MKLSAYTDHIFQKRIRQSILSEEVFQRILDRERGRSDRNGGFFSLLDVTLSDTPADPGILSLLHVLKDRMRTTDAIGWLENGHVGVIMPDTTLEGAARLIEDVKSQLAADSAILDFTIYRYPETGQTGQHQPSCTLSSDTSAGSSVFSRLTCKPIPIWKRSLDILGAILALILLCPLFVIIAIYIKIVSPGPVFFKQERIGYASRPFMCWKFRTMAFDTDPEQHKAHVTSLIRNRETWRKLDDRPDSGIIPCGNILRKSGLDELPQLFNVIRGDMSLIGPRPCIVYEAAQFSLWHNRRFDIHPGLTGLWQVSGKNRTSFEEMMRLDIHYGRKRSFVRDAVIFFKTFPAVIRQFNEKSRI